MPSSMDRGLTSSAHSRSSWPNSPLDTIGQRLVDVLPLPDASSDVRASKSLHNTPIATSRSPKSPARELAERMERLLSSAVSTDWCADGLCAHDHQHSPQGGDRLVVDLSRLRGLSLPWAQRPSTGQCSNTSSPCGQGFQGRSERGEESFKSIKSLLSQPASNSPAGGSPYFQDNEHEDLSDVLSRPAMLQRTRARPWKVGALTRNRTDRRAVSHE